MTNEEKKAIENLKEVVDLYNDECLITTDYDFKSIEILLNLIENQSKEIVKLKKDYSDMLLQENTISKDKIKEKIKEIIEGDYTDLEIMLVLQSLLEEE